ncbi:MAG: hypothetical protein J5545_10290 [Bacteroidaceae bacterium]|nr:hypothetical protein [Bacteroidaceae bacterium]
MKNARFLSLLPSAAFLLLTWFWAAWWMGDIGLMAYENSFVTADSTLMHWLWQQPFGVLWIVGRVLLLTYHWPWVGGLLVAVLLTAGSWLVGYCLRMPQRWRFLQYLPAGVWMTWVAWLGLNVFYQHEPGRPLGVLFLVVLVCAIDAFIIWTFKSRRKSVVTADVKSKKPAVPHYSFYLLHLLVFLLCLSVPMALTHARYPYARPVTRMQVQMQQQDWNGMAETARANAHLSYRPLAAYYAVALVHNGRLADDLFDIRLDYDTLYLKDRAGKGDVGSNYYTIDCNFHAGLVRPATHRAMELLTMEGPSLFSLKMLTRCALLDHHWQLARKYLHIIGKAPFEGAFVEKYSAMIEHPELIDADPEFNVVQRTMPIEDSFESMYQEPIFLGYAVDLMQGRSKEALIQSLMANLYSKRMPAFLMRCEPLVGTTPPLSIGQGLVTQARKFPDVLKAFPSLDMEMRRFVSFLQVVQPYMQDRPRGGIELFDQYHGYYPYYYFFGNLKATRKTNTQDSSSAAGVN